jgi:hypothetical protein
VHSVNSSVGDLLVVSAGTKVALSEFGRLVFPSSSGVAIRNGNTQRNGNQILIRMKCSGSLVRKITPAKLFQNRALYLDSPLPLPPRSP